MSRSNRSSVFVGVWTGVLAFASVASAQTTVTTTEAAPAPAPAAVVVQPAPAPVATTTTTSAVVSDPTVARESHTEAYVPNPYLLTTGFVLFGGSYITSVVVAAESGNSADQHLYVPIVGPWVDMANRGGCPVGNNSCNNETTNKVLLGVDGALQAIGTLEVIWGFLRPVHEEVTVVHATRYTPEIHFEPSNVASGYGLTAFGRF
jgi:hypothetical protein